MQKLQKLQFGGPERPRAAPRRRDAAAEGRDADRGRRAEQGEGARRLRSWIAHSELDRIFI